MQPPANSVALSPVNGPQRVLIVPTGPKTVIVSTENVTMVADTSISVIQESGLSSPNETVIDVSATTVPLSTQGQQQPNAGGSQTLGGGTSISSLNQVNPSVHSVDGQGAPPQEPYTPPEPGEAVGDPLTDKLIRASGPLGGLLRRVLPSSEQETNKPQGEENNK